MLATKDVPEEEFQQQLRLLEQMRETPEWQDALQRNAWTDAWETGEDLDRFIAEDDEKTAALLEELGL